MINLTVKDYDGVSKSFHFANLETLPETLATGYGPNLEDIVTEITVDGISILGDVTDYTFNSIGSDDVWVEDLLTYLNLLNRLYQMVYANSKF